MNICRCCLTHDGTLFSICDDRINTGDCCLAYMIDQVTSIKIKSDDKLPYKVCILCISDIHRFYDFKLKCEKSNKMLQQLCCYKVHLGSALNSNNIMEDYQDDTDSNHVPETVIISEQDCNETNIFSNSKQNDNHVTDFISDASRDNIATNSINLTESTSVVACENHKGNRAVSNSALNLNHLKNNDTNDGSHYHCAICKKDFLNNHELNSHLEWHKKPYVFYEYLTLRDHMMGNTADNISYNKNRLNLCPKRFKTSAPTHFRIHTAEKSTVEQTIHEGQPTSKRPFKCSYCDKSYTTVNRQKSHERLHTAGKRFKCSYCDKIFTTASGRKCHERTHNKVKPFKCSYCGKGFKSADVRRNHERLHTGEKTLCCSYCDKIFTTASERKCHERLHSGEKQYKCSYCCKVFKGELARRIHESSHTPSLIEM